MDENVIWLFDGPAATLAVWISGEPGERLLNVQDMDMSDPLNPREKFGPVSLRVAAVPLLVSLVVDAYNNETGRRIIAEDRTP